MERLESPLSTYYLLVGVVGVLLLFGLVMVLSASSVSSLSAPGRSSFTIFAAQARFAAIGLVAALVASRVSLAFWKRIAVPSLIGSMLLQLLVFSPLGRDINGNRNWLSLGPIQIQPSELGKLSLILFAATILTAKRKMIGEWLHAVIPVILPAGVGFVGLVLLGHDLGTALVLLAILAALLWASGVSWKLFGVAGGVALAGVLAMVAVSSNRMDRIAAWLSCTDVHQCWQSANGQYALADGGLGGLGLGASREKWLWLPEAHNDFIFAIIGEELGIGGTLVILVLFSLLAMACYRLVLASNDMFVRIATTGVMVWIISQAFINIGAVIGLLPVIGVPLPLVSAGGSALVTTLIGLGMVISFARNEPATRRALAARPSAISRSMSILAPRRARRDGRPTRAGRAGGSAGGAER